MHVHVYVFRGKFDAALPDRVPVNVMRHLGKPQRYLNYSHAIYIRVIYFLAIILYITVEA